MNKTYYINLNGQHYGPYRLENFRDYPLEEDTLVSYNRTVWKPAIDFPELEIYIKTTHQENNEAPDIYKLSYYYQENNQIYGPFSIMELVYLDIKDDTLLGINGMNNWKYAKNIDNLLNTLTHLRDLEKEEYDSELQKIKSEYSELLEEQSLKHEEVILNKQELEEIIESQEKNLIKLEEENVVLKQYISRTVNEEETITKESLLNLVKDFRDNLSNENKQHFIRSYPSISYELLDKIDYYNAACDQFIALMNLMGDQTQKWIASGGMESRSKNEILSAIHNVTEQFYRQNPAIAPNFYETADSDNIVWKQLQPQSHHFPTSSFLVGKNVIVFNIFDDMFSFTKFEYAIILDKKNIVVHYDKKTKKECFDFINTLTARLFMASLPGKFKITTIDAQEMEGISDLFKSLNKSVSFYSREKEIQDCLEEKTQYIENVIQNLLLHPIKNIGEYNQGKENPEEYQLLIIKAFPVGLTNTSLTLLKQLMKNGQRAGIHIVLMIDKDEIESSENAKKEYIAFELDKFDHLLLTYDFISARYPFSTDKNIQHFNFEKIGVSQIQDIVRYVNRSLETKPAEVVTFANFVPAQLDWWKHESSNMIEIPFGISEEKELVSLSITQESGQNSAVVIGIPGSGKSVFLHTIISNSAIHYSPEELELFLMDFSGVEFDTYARHNLPHAKVIAPEAEREFGLSVLRELKEEGSRRMELCRKNEVSNIVDLRTKCPDKKIPRQLIIIDEFQKLFEIENDNISKEAMTIIHIIIKEFRKFGINLILATQKLSDIHSYILPKDLIANRIVFKCSPADIGLIGLNTVPYLRTGECFYNSESGVVDTNKKVQTFFIPKKEIDNLLKQVKSFGLINNYKEKNVIIFRSADLPDFKNHGITPQEDPVDVDIFFGQPIAISDYDVSATLHKSSNDNILIIGGEEDVAQKIAINSSLSAMAYYSDKSAKWYFFNFMRPSDPLFQLPASYFSGNCFEIVFVSKTNEVIEAMQEIKTEIDARKVDENRAQQHIYLSFYSFQLAQMFKKGGRRGEDVSEAGKLLNYILNNGPLVGVFTILQVDNVANLQQIGDTISFFSHRVALQMEERDSGKIVGSDVANRLYVMNRPSSKNRCYYYNNKNRILVKFKPYK
ncbi:MAG: FtsK/SpoIIIE domain-containing protein [Marinilabiliaceae bacterium]|nr:FtsK/SpoIIIE domain-containing protein [Marinilabiliaceae bacterium]